MKKGLRFIVFTCFLAINLHSQNLLTNGGFDQWTLPAAELPTAWARGAGAWNTNYKFATDATQGNVLYLRDTISGTAAARRFHYNSYLNIENGATYRVTFKVKGNVGLRAVVLVKGTTSPNTSTQSATNRFASLSDYASTTVVDDWTTVQCDIEVPSDASFGSDTRFHISWSHSTTTKLCNFYIDDIQLVKLVKLGKLATPTVGVATDIKTTGFVANWTPVADAESYDVLVYQGATFITSSSFNGQSTSSGPIYGAMLPNTTYAYTVIAKARTFHDSEASEISSSFTTNTSNSLSYYADRNDGLKIGAAVGSQFYIEYDSNSTYDILVKENFNILVAENEMKFKSLQPTQGNFSFTKPDILVNYAQKYGKQLRGHTLCWHSSLPTWITDGTFTREQLLAILKNHIFTVVTRYKGKVQAWDVVNEPFNDAGNGLRTDSKWQQVIGNDYIDSAFVWAHQADPDAKLYINDYSAEIFGAAKSNYMYNYIVAMKNRGIPIHGAGLQCHFIAGNIDINNFDKNIKRYATQGLEAVITELDVRINVSYYNNNPTTWLNTQADNYKKLIQLSLNNCNAKTFVTWGFTDLYSWIPNFTNNTYDHSLIFDKNFAPKPAYTAILNELMLRAVTTRAPHVQLPNKINYQNANGVLTVRCDDEGTKMLSLMNTAGVIVHQINSSENIVEINTAQLPKGLYLLAVIAANKQYKTQKLLVE